MKKAVVGIVCILAVLVVYYKTRSLSEKIEINYSVYKSLGLKWEGWINKGIEPIDDVNYKLTYQSSDYDVDQIYTSMLGPASIHYFSIDNSKEELLWVTEVKAEVQDAEDSEQLPGELLCHMNMDFHAPEHFGKWGLNRRIDNDYSRVVTLSSGFQHLKLPEGFGFPIYSNEKLIYDSQVLNLNDPDPGNLRVNHKIEMIFRKDSPEKRPIPLTPIPLVVFRPFNQESPHKKMESPNSCLPVDPQHHSYVEDDGQSLTGHWIVPPGRETTVFNVDKPLGLQEATTVHHAVTHIHPFCERLALRDITTDSILIDLRMEGFADKIGLKKIDMFNSVEGVKITPEHSYELILEVNNTTGKNQDMMAVMMLFIRDAEMEKKINERYN